MHLSDAAAAKSLDDFAPRLSTNCTVCLLPLVVREELESARLGDPQRFTFPVISKWLTAEHGAEVSDSSLRRHFTRGHHHARAGVAADQPGTTAGGRG